MNTIQVQTKERKNRPSVPTKFTVEIEHNKSISIYADGELKKSFRIGDMAEYGRYNLIYTGNITKITDKMVQVTAYIDTPLQQKHNLDLYKFCWMNEDFDLQKVNAHNHSEMYFI